MGALKQAELGVPLAELIRQVGITTQTLLSLEEAAQGAGNRSIIYSLEPFVPKAFDHLQERAGMDTLE